jgi:putative (di)nucleoside polyphosphate hydrolase
VVKQVIDCEGYRANVGIILSNREGRVLWCKRVGQNAWQFPQGGIQPDETPEQALFRELREETGLQPEHVKIIARTKTWLRYRLPRHLIRRHTTPCCIGQKQVWFMLRLMGDEECVNLARSDKPEFDGWRWVDYWLPMHEVVFFKRRVYRRALSELAPFLFGGAALPCSPRMDEWL